ncbi:MAG: M48 family metallopeptidase [Candidatus Lambdaproteobacteria bacterium]|nr:M48 family metallopeptidase [Candidatus Lambdaproteobacteria bacterium]
MNTRLNTASLDIPYTLRRSRRRRTISVTIDPDRGMLVHCPQRLPQAEIDAFLRRKAKWIRSKMALIDSIRASQKPISWQDGAALPYQGASYTLRIRADASGGSVSLHGGIIEVACGLAGQQPADETSESLVMAWYRREAERVIQQRVAHFQEHVGVTPSRVCVKDQKRRWGTCTSRGALYFNWRLILAPLHVLDYVVVHELCHLLELNHSPRFWSLVSSVLPDYRQRRSWLRQQGASLEIQQRPAMVH